MNSRNSCFIICLLSACSIRAYRLGEETFAAQEERPAIGVINGSAVPITKFPYMASYRVKGNLVGSGVIIDKQWILTTAYIVKGFNISDIEFRVGSNKYSISGEVLKIEQIIIHENFKLGSWDNDIAVVKVKPMKFGKRVKPISLATQDLKGGSKGVVSGWGEKDKSGIPSKVLLAAEVTVVDWKTCNETFSPQLTPRMMCTHDKTVGPCVHDFGDPLVVDKAVHGLFCGGCCDPFKTPVIYTDVPALYSWIKNKTAT